MKKCILIPMRGGSKGIPRKNLVSFEGRPLYEHVINAAISSKIDDIFVSTEDQEIKEKVSKYREVTLIHRPDKFADDLSTDYEVFKHFINVYPQYDYIIHLRATWPKINKTIISNAVDFFEERYDKCSSMRSVESSKELPWKMWFVRDNYHLEPVIQPPNNLEVERHSIEHFSMPRQILEKAYYQNAAIDIIKSDTITLQKSTVGDNPVAFIMDDMVENGIDIDTEDDLR